MTTPVTVRPSNHPIIDCHVHINNYHEQEAVSLEESLDKLQRAMDEAGVTSDSVLFRRGSLGEPGGSGAFSFP